MANYLLIAVLLLASILLSLSSPSFSFSIFGSSLEFPHHKTSIAKDGRIGFTSHLIHHSSPQSPFYNPNLTHSDRVRAAVRHSFARHRYFQLVSNPKRTTPNWAQAAMTPFSGEYVMKYCIGTPPTETFAIADTGSELIWLQCLPCKCFKQKLPIFDPTKSSSYAKIGCKDNECTLLPTVRCAKDNSSCYYDESYEDEAFSRGILSTETLVFGDTGPSGNISLTEMIFGCGHDNRDPVEGNNAPGMIGLNKKALSFVSQLAYIQFSYCLVVYNASNLSSKIHFGLSAVITSGTTPILNEGTEDFYYLSLEGISVGKNRLQIPAGSFNVTKEGDGGFIIDSGSTYSAIKSEVFALLISEMENQINLERGVDPEGGFALCYKCKFEDLEKAPHLTFHFSGVDLVLSTLNTWLDIGDEGIFCLAMFAVDGSPSVFGHHQQQNLNVGYDLKNKMISFKSMDCTNT